MIDVRLPELRAHAFEGNFGLEREALRVTDEGRMAHTPHPFSADHPRVVRDFCENQTEINTRVWPTAEEAVAELKEIDAAIHAAIAPQGETLWTNSNPPPISDESEIVPARFPRQLLLRRASSRRVGRGQECTLSARRVRVRRLGLDRRCAYRGESARRRLVTLARVGK